MGGGRTEGPTASPAIPRRPASSVGPDVTIPTSRGLHDNGSGNICVEGK
jgi:hypothetical protein